MKSQHTVLKEVKEENRRQQKDRIKALKEELKNINVLAEYIKIQKSDLRERVDKVNDEINEISGPFTQRFTDVLDQKALKCQIYHSGALILRLAALEDNCKKKKREALEQSRLRAVQKAMEDVSIDGQQKDRAGVEAMLNKYVTAKEEKDVIKRQLNYYKTLKIKSVPYQKYNITCAGKEHSVKILAENLIFIIEVWSGIFNSDSAASNSSPSTPQVPN